MYFKTIESQFKAENKTKTNLSTNNKIDSINKTNKYKHKEENFIGDGSFVNSSNKVQESDTNSSEWQFYGASTSQNSFKDEHKAIEKKYIQKNVQHLSEYIIILIKL